MIARKEWVKLPSRWIEDDGLRAFRWRGPPGAGASNAAALMTLIALAHHAEDQEGVVKLTYDALCIVTGLSRAKLSKGLDVLEEREIVARGLGRSVYRLSDFNPAGGWAKLPCRALYSGNRIAAFDDFKLRGAAELNALKLYLLFAARRGRDTNMANISFEKIAEYTGMERARIKAALSVLAVNNLAHIERVPSTTNAIGVANAYRLVGLDTYNHMGTTGRGMDPAVLAAELT